MLGIYHETQRESPRVICGVEKEYGEEYKKKDQSTLFETMVVSILAIFSYSYATMRV